MKKSTPILVSRPSTLAGLVAACLWLMLCLPAQAFVLDNFNSGKSGWTDTLNGGNATVASGQFILTTATGNGALTASIKTTAPAPLGSVFTPVAGHTLELRVDANNTFDAATDTNALAILAWVPSGGTILGNGYSLMVGANDIRIQKAAAVLYSNDTVGFARTNLTLVLRITPSGNSVILNARVYRQVGNGASGQYATAIFEQTEIDASGSLIGVGGNAGLAVRNQANPSGSTITYDNLQVFDIINSVLDDFSSGSLASWTTFAQHPSGPDSVTISGGQAQFIAYPDPNAGFAGMYYKDKTFIIQDGGRLEFSIDCINNSGSLHSYTVIGFVPATGSTAATYLKSLIEYHLAADPANTYNGKAYNGWWGHTTGGFPSSNFRLTVTFTGEGTNCRVESRGEDLSLDVNNPGRVFYQNVALDTLAKDQFEQVAPASSFTTPFITVAGSFAIDTFNDSVGIADIILDNAIVNQTIPPNLPPVLNNLFPAAGANFIASSNHLTFDLSDEVNVVSNGIVVNLNGVLYTNGSPGVTITPATGTSANRHVDLAGALADNVYYIGTIQAADAQGATTITPLSFDTFLTNAYVVESEEFNFSSDSGLTGGAFIDNPKLNGQGSGGDPLAYNGVVGVAEIDFHDNRASGGIGFDANHDFRLDNPYNSRSSDFRRPKYANAGLEGDGGYNEEEVTDIRDGDWLNYTHTYPSGTYSIYLRQAQYAMPVSLVTLDQVTSDPTITNQTSAILGAFIDRTPTGPGQFRNVSLTDGVGNPIVARFDGTKKTLRISQRLTGNADSSSGILEQNYLAFIPGADPGILRPIVSLASPLANSAIAPNPGSGSTSSSPNTAATIANRDTTVNTGSIVLKMNGNPVAATITPISGGANVVWPLSVLPPTAIITNSITFLDSDGTNLTYSWTYSYPFLRASNSLPVNSLSFRGFDVRMVQAADVGAADNSLGTAEQQLAVPPEILNDVSATNVVQELVWNDDTCSPCVPGLTDPGHNNIAVESFGYVYLTAGAHRFHASSDDGFQLRSGAHLRDPGAVVLGARDGGTFNGTFDFVVEADGLYPVRCLWYEHGGSANFQLNSVNLGDNSEVAVNDPADPAGVAKVYYPLVCLSSANVSGLFTPEATAVYAGVTTVGGTITIPQSGTARFYRLDGLRRMKITSVVRSGSSIVLTYQNQ